MIRWTVSERQLIYVDCTGLSIEAIGQDAERFCFAMPFKEEGGNGQITLPRDSAGK